MVDIDASLPSKAQNESGTVSELDACRAQSEEYLRSWKRAEADLINYRKSEEERIGQFMKFGNELLVHDVLDAVDNLDIALQHAPEGTDQTWLKGIGHVHQQFLELIKRQGVERMTVVGEPFDPLRHEALVVDENVDGGQKVLEELRAGYIMHDKVIRPARVKISK